MMFHDGNLLGVFVVVSVSIHSSKDSYYTIVSSICIQLGAVVDVLYDGVMFVRMTWYTDDSVTTIHDDVMLLSVLYVGYDEIYIVQWERYKW